MADFSSFFPAAGGGGGGGFTKMIKYSTLSALADANVRQGGTSAIRTYPTQRTGSSLASGSTKITFYTEGWASSLSAALLVGTTFDYNSQTHTVTARDNNDSGRLNITFTPALTGDIPGNFSVTFTSASAITVNPANDLGLADGASLGYFMVGGGNSNAGTTSGAKGGNILQGTKIITTASTNLVLTPGAATAGQVGAASTISGGLTLTTANGANQGTISKDNSKANSNAWGGINGYGLGGGLWNEGGAYGTIGQNFHGFGGGSYNTQVAGDGAILLFY